MNNDVEAIKTRINDRLFNKIENLNVSLESGASSLLAPKISRLKRYLSRLKPKLSKIPLINYIILWGWNFLKLPVKFRELHQKSDILANNFGQLSLQLDELSAKVIVKEPDINLIVNKPSYFPLEDNNILFKEESAVYGVFEDAFRGSKELTIQKQKAYLDYIKEIDAKGRYFLDVGCGRGEFLELLSKAKIKIKGIEISQSEYANLKKEGFDVELNDANSYLNGIDNSSLIGISAFQVIEHFDLDYAKKFLSQSFQKIAEGGIIILETINTKCSFALNNYFMDFTHLKPYPPEALKFLTELYGFKEVKIIYSSPCPEEFRVNNYIEHNYLDYAVVGWKK